jgi:midasin
LQEEEDVFEDGDDEDADAAGADEEEDAAAAADGGEAEVYGIDESKTVAGMLESDGRSKRGEDDGSGDEDDGPHDHDDDDDDDDDEDDSAVAAGSASLRDEGGSAEASARDTARERSGGSDAAPDADDPGASGLVDRRLADGDGDDDDDEDEDEDGAAMGAGGLGAAASRPRQTPSQQRQEQEDDRAAAETASDAAGDAIDEEELRMIAAAALGMAEPLRDGDDGSLVGSAGSVERLTGAREAWSALSSLTAASAGALCETLRTLLEPTVAGGLEGDYRTGKRLNMRRVVGYIASGYRRDRIWLRRTRPWKRQYQVLLAVDDSRSMRGGITGASLRAEPSAEPSAEPRSVSRAESLSGGAGGAACEAVCLIWQALARLEVGSVGVMSFGERPTLLHPLSAPLSDEAGAEVMAGLSFAHARSDTLGAVAAASAVLEMARETLGGGGGGDGQAGCEQLLLLITDGLVAPPAQRAEMRRRVAELRDSGVLVVLIVVDDPDPASSITVTETVTMTPAGGIERQPYLADFPIADYVIAKKTSDLPGAVSGAVRQWVEQQPGRG